VNVRFTFLCNSDTDGPPLWCSGQSSWLRIPVSITGATRFSDKLVGLERGSLTLVRITEELLEWKSSGSGSIKPRLRAVRILGADHATPSIRKIWH
jgi:hypothetical protein